VIYLAANNSRVWVYREKGYPMGWCMSPAGWRRPDRGGERMPFALDNGLYHPPDSPPKGMKALPPFYRMLDKCLAGGFSPLFVVAPDVPYNGDATRALSRKHARHIREHGYTGRIALAVQDGMTPDDLDGFDAVFVAGSTEWKWRTAPEWCDEAHARGLWAHVARVNTIRRVRLCVDMHADSADGTGIWRGDRAQLGGVLRALVEPHLFRSAV